MLYAPDDVAEEWLLEHLYEPEFDAVMRFISGTLCEAEDPIAHAESTSEISPPFAYVPDARHIAVTFFAFPKHQVLDVERIEDRRLDS